MTTVVEVWGQGPTGSFSKINCRQKIYFILFYLTWLIIILELYNLTTTVRSPNFTIYNCMDHEKTFLTSDSKLNILWDFKVCFKDSWPFSSKLHHWGHARQLSTYTRLSNNWPSMTLMSYKKVNTFVQYAFSIKYVQIKSYFKSFTL